MLYLEEWDCFAPASFKGAQPMCYYCRKSGHVKKDCEALQALTCFQCGNKGHIRRNCRASEFYNQPSRKETSFEEDLDQYTQKRDEVFEASTKDDPSTNGEELLVDSEVLCDMDSDPTGDGNSATKGSPVW